MLKSITAKHHELLTSAIFNFQIPAPGLTLVTPQPPYHALKWSPEWFALATVTKVWVSLLIALVPAQTAASLLMSRGSALTIASDLIHGSLLAVPTSALLPNTAHSRRP